MGFSTGPSNVALYAESTAGNAGHFKSGQTNRALPATSLGSSLNHANGAISIPRPLNIDGSMHVHARAVGAVKLPMLTVAGGSGGAAEITLPSLLVSGSGTNQIILRGDIALPMLIAAGTGLTGFTAQGAISIPRPLRVYGQSGFTGGAVLPSLKVAGHARVDLHITGAIVLPKLTVMALGHRSMEAAEGYIVLPKLRSSPNSYGNLLLPKILVAGNATNANPSVARAWVMNVKNRAVTEWLNYGFRNFVRFNNQYYGVGMSGNLYLIGGDLDVLAAIPWAWETGLNDFDSPALKGIDAVYVEGLMERGANLTIVTDKKQRYTYATKSVPGVADRRTYRIETGKGIRTCNIGLAMSNTLGGYVELDKLSARYYISKRNIG